MPVSKLVAGQAPFVQECMNLITINEYNYVVISRDNSVRNTNRLAREIYTTETYEWILPGEKHVIHDTLEFMCPKIESNQFKRQS